MTVLAVEGLGKSFGGVAAVRGVSFRIEAGEMLALIGPNGAGKSTCFNMVGGQLRPDAGTILLDGQPIAGLAPQAIWRLGVGRTFQVTATLASMTVQENVQMALISHAGGVWRAWGAARLQHVAPARALLEQVGLGDQWDRAAGLLAYGDLKRLELAVALASEPRLLLMDEPTAGMAPAERFALMALARRVATGRRLAILFTEHDMDVVFGTADRILVLDHGALIAEGDGPAIRANARVRQVYLGAGECSTAAARQPHPLQPGPLKPLLTVENLNSFYGRAHILRDLSFAVLPGETLVLLGRNGAGKSTTLKSLIGLVRPASGSIRFAGQEIAGREPYRIARHGLGYVPEERRVFAGLTVAENLDAARRPRRPGAAPWTAARLFALFPNLGPLRHRAAASMSGGEQQMLSIARTLMGNPRLILLDEPTEGLAPLVVEQMAAAILALRAEGVTVLLAEQNLHFAARVADRAVILEQGRIAWAGTLPELQANPAARIQHLAV